MTKGIRRYENHLNGVLCLPSDELPGYTYSIGKPKVHWDRCAAWSLLVLEDRYTTLTLSCCFVLFCFAFEEDCTIYRECWNCRDLMRHYLPVIWWNMTGECQTRPQIRRDDLNSTKPDLLETMDCMVEEWQHKGLMNLVASGVWQVLPGQVLPLFWCRYSPVTACNAVFIILL